jgi:hypothetical protein
VLFNTALSNAEIKLQIISKDTTQGLEGCHCGLFEGFNPAVTLKICEKIAGNPAKIQTEYLPKFGSTPALLVGKGNSKSLRGKFSSWLIGRCSQTF